MKTQAALAAPGHYREADFFDGADALRARFDEACARGAGNGVDALSRVDACGAYSFLMATAEQVFPHAVVLGFLSRLREWGMEHLGARHASTPQIHVYVDGCARALAPDATPAKHHYLYSLTRGDGACIRVLGSSNGHRKFLGIGVSHLASVSLRFNDLFVHEANLAYGIEGPRGAKDLPGAAVLLHGYIW